MLRRCIIAALSLFYVASANAADFSKPILEADGTPVCSEKNGKECAADKVMTVGIAVRNALFAPSDDRNLTGEDKYKRFVLAMALSDPNFQPKAEDIALMKQVVGKVYGPLVVGQVWQAIDPNAK